MEPQEGDLGEPPFARVLHNIRTLNNAGPGSYSTIEVSPLLNESWGKFEEMVVGTRSSLSEKKSKLLLPIPLCPQSRWCDFSDSTEGIL